MLFTVLHDHLHYEHHQEENSGYSFSQTWHTNILSAKILFSTESHQPFRIQQGMENVSGSFIYLDDPWTHWILEVLLPLVGLAIHQDQPLLVHRLCLGHHYLQDCLETHQFQNCLLILVGLPLLQGQMGPCHLLGQWNLKIKVKFQQHHRNVFVRMFSLDREADQVQKRKAWVSPPPQNNRFEDVKWSWFGVHDIFGKVFHILLQPRGKTGYYSLPIPSLKTPPSSEIYTVERTA